MKAPRRRSRGKGWCEDIVKVTDGILYSRERTQTQMQRIKNDES